MATSSGVIFFGNNLQTTGCNSSYWHAVEFLSCSYVSGEMKTGLEKATFYKVTCRQSGLLSAIFLLVFVDPKHYKQKCYLGFATPGLLLQSLPISEWRRLRCASWSLSWIASASLISACWGLAEPSNAAMVKFAELACSIILRLSTKTWK